MKHINVAGGVFSLGSAIVLFADHFADSGVDRLTTVSGT